MTQRLRGLFRNTISNFSVNLNSNFTYSSQSPPPQTFFFLFLSSQCYRIAIIILWYNDCEDYLEIIHKQFLQKSEFKFYLILAIALPNTHFLSLLKINLHRSRNNSQLRVSSHLFYLFFTIPSRPRAELKTSILLISYFSVILLSTENIVAGSTAEERNSESRLSCVTTSVRYRVVWNAWKCTQVTRKREKQQRASAGEGRRGSERGERHRWSLAGEMRRQWRSRGGNRGKW